MKLFYNHFFLFLTKLIPIRNVRRNARNTISYKISHPKAANFLQKNYINPFLNGEIKESRFEKLADFKDEKIIWQFWFQGRENANNMIDSCFKSVQKQMGGGGYKIIILDEKTIKNYINFPPFIYEKLANKTFGDKTIAFFSDLLRVSLLATYGGIWIDATIFLSDKIPDELLEKDFFMFERAKEPKLDKRFQKSDYFTCGYFNYNDDYLVKIFSSFIVARAKNKQICALRDILMAYWQKEQNTKNHEYFALHIIFELLRQNGFTNSSYKNSDIECHLLQFVAKESFDKKLWEEIEEQSFLHKLTHFKSIAKDSMIDEIVLKD